MQKSGFSIGLVRPGILLFWSFTANFLLCNFGEQVLNEIESITDGIYELDWYTFPIEIQKMLLTIMTATQRPLHFRGFGNILLTRSSFKAVNIFRSAHVLNRRTKRHFDFIQVTNGGYSYFTVLRRFNN